MQTQSVMIPKTHLSQGSPIYRMPQMSQEGVAGKTQGKRAHPLGFKWWGGGQGGARVIFRKQCVAGCTRGPPKDLPGSSMLRPKNCCLVGDH